MKRKIIEIDRALCNGCSLCTTACAEGALELDRAGKAVLIRDIYCEGLGACLNVCPTGALKVVEKEAATYDEDATRAHVTATKGAEAAAAVHRGADRAARGHDHDHACPGSLARRFEPASQRRGLSQSGALVAAALASSELGQWPIQLHLVSPSAPYFNECDLLVAADCTAFALGSFHADLLRSKSLVIACPKLDRTEGYVEKLTELIASNTIFSITVAIMEVPCCLGLSRTVQEAVARSKKNISVRTVVIGIDGQRK